MGHSPDANNTYDSNWMNGQNKEGDLPGGTARRYYHVVEIMSERYCFGPGPQANDTRTVRLVKQNVCWQSRIVCGHPAYKESSC